MATFSYSFTFSNSTTADGGNVQTVLNDARTFALNSVMHDDGTNSINGYRCRRRRAATQSIPQNTLTAISFDTTDEDPQTMATNATTFTCKATGWYLLHVESHFATARTAITNQVFWNVPSNSWGQNLLGTCYGRSAGTDKNDMAVTALTKLTLNDTFTCVWYHNDSQANNITAIANVVRVG